MKDEKITAIGDIHNGAAVTLVEKDGKMFIRKPRSGANELAFKAFLSELQEKGFLYLPGTVNVIYSDSEMQEVEIVRNNEAKSKDEIKLYYRRCGALIFFAYIFSSNDLHYENIIANGSFPTVIDYETLLTPDFGRNNSGIFLQSAAVSHLLPNWRRENNEDVDVGGITGEYLNIPKYNGKHEYAYDYIDDILTGFEYSYGFALDNMNMFERLIHLFDNCKFRVLMRPTVTYSNILDLIKGENEDYQRDIAYTILERAYEKDRDKQRVIQAQKAIESEINSLLKGDIPIFWVSGNGCDLLDKYGCVWENLFSRSSVERCSEKLGKFCRKDMENQKKLIRQSLLTVLPVSRNTSKKSEYKDPVETIFHTLEERNIEGSPDGWTGLRRDKNERLYFKGVGTGLYNGIFGILCCYASMFRKTGDRKFLEALNKYYSCYCDFLSDETVPLTDFSSSLQDGVGGKISALCHISELIGDMRFYEDARNIIEKIVIPSTPLTGNFDVLGGFGGLAIMLPKIKSPKVLDVASVLAEVMLKSEPELTGVAHGAAGVALALGALGSILNTNEFDKRIIELLKKENLTFDKDDCDWRDLRNQNKKCYMRGWCSGGPGIGMSRKKLAEYTENEEIAEICSEDIKKSLIMLEKMPFLKKDCICCGNGSKLMAVSYLGATADYTYERLCTKVQNGVVDYMHLIDTSDLDSGLMQGTAGIGYVISMYKDKMCGGMLL